MGAKNIFRLLEMLSTVQYILICIIFALNNNIPYHYSLMYVCTVLYYQTISYIQYNCFLCLLLHDMKLFII